MVDSTTTGTVGIGINANGINAAAQKVQQNVRDIGKEINKAGENLNSQLRIMAGMFKQIQTLQSFQTKSMMGDFGFKNLGKQAREVAEFRNGISKTSDTMGILRGRMVALDVANGKLFSQGKNVPKNSLLRAENIEQTAKAYGKASNEVSNLRGRISQLGEGAQNSFAPILKTLDDLDAKNAKIFANPNRYSFGRQTDQYTKVTAELRDQVVLAEKASQSERRRLDLLTKEGQQILANNRYQREADAANAVRAASRTFSNRDLIGAEAPYRRQIDLTNRLATQVKFLELSKRQLNAELAKPVEQRNAARVDQLINRYKILQREIGETTLLRAKEDASSKNQGGFLGGLKSGIKSAGGGAEEGTFGVGSLVGRVGAYAVAAGAVYGLVSSIRDGIKFAIDFEDALAQLQAVSGSTTVEMERLSSGILEVSKTSSQSILELTKAATIIAQAGYAGNEIQGILASVTRLADASGSSPDESVDILTSALGSFQLAASEADRVTNSLVATLNESKLSVNQVQLGLQYVGATARLNNITFEELTATLGAMADAGIRSGSTMSTGLRQMLVDFLDPSEKLITQLKNVGLSTSDIDVKVLGLTEVLTRLRDRGFQAYGSLETRAAAAYSVLSSNVEQIERLEQASLQQGVAEEAQAARLDSLSVKWGQLLKTLQEIAINIFNGVSPALGVMVDGLNKTIMAVDTLSGWLRAIPTPLSIMRDLLGDNTTGLEDYSSALAAAGLTGEDLATAQDVLSKGLEYVETASKDARAEVLDLETQQGSLRQETIKLITRSNELGSSQGSVANQVNILASSFPGLRAEFAKTQGGIAGLINSLYALDDKLQQSILMKLRLESTTLGVEQRENHKRGVNALTNFDRATSGRGGFDTSGFGRLNSGVVTSQLLSQNKGVQEVRQLVSSGDREKMLLGLEKYNALPAQIQKILDKTMKPVANYLAEYQSISGRRENNLIDRQSAEYSLSGTGRRIRRSGAIVTADGDRVASQGTSTNGRTEEQVRGTIERNIAFLEREQEKYANNTGVTRFLELAIADQQSAKSVMTEDTTKEDKAADAAAKRASAKSKRDQAAAARAAAKDAREAEKRQRELERIDGKIQKEEIEYRKTLYENTVDSFKNAGSIDDLPDILEDVDEQMKDWLNGEASLALQSIEALRPTEAQKLTMMETAGRAAEELRVEQVNKVADALGKALSEYLKVTTEAIENQYEQAMRFTERNVSKAQARLNGLNNPLNAGNTPEYVKTLAQRDLDIANDRRDRADYAASSVKISDQASLIAKLRESKADLEIQVNDLGKKIESGVQGEDAIVVQASYDIQRKKLDDLQRELDEAGLSLLKFKDRQEDLAISLGANETVPTGLFSGILAALKAINIEANAARSPLQEVINGIDAPIRAASNGLGDALAKVITGTEKVSDAFGAMRDSIRATFMQILTDMITKQFIKLIAGLAGSLFGGSFASSSSDLLSANAGLSWNGAGVSAGGLWRGGQVKGYMGGGEITSGLGTRDSTLINAAKGEHIIRRPAAQSLGKGFLDAINARGADALKGMGTNIIPMPQAQSSPVNVYVVAPDQKPSMGPNDVLATFSNDVLKGGMTKKLIKQVAAGG